MKNLWIIANWKSNKNLVEALEWVSVVGPEIPRQKNLKVVVCPTYTALEEVGKAIQVGNFPLMVGSQDLSPFSAGAYTGEEPASILKQFVDISILGHSERRQNLNESDELVEKKLSQAMANNIIPLVCVQGKETPVPQNCQMIAYEPIFAIGTGKPDSPVDANKIADSFRQKYGNNLQVIYGGSVDSDNVKDFVTQEFISGVLIGSASLDAAEFVSIIQNCLRTSTYSV